MLSSLLYNDSLGGAEMSTHPGGRRLWLDWKDLSREMHRVNLWKNCAAATREVEGTLGKPGFQRPSCKGMTPFCLEKTHAIVENVNWFKTWNGPSLTRILK
jgi:hypothetical protein